MRENMNPKKEVMKTIENMKEETEELTELFESLEIGELLSLRKSNRFSRDMIRHYKMYMPQRAIKDVLPVITSCAIASGVIQLFCKNTQIKT